MLAHVMGQELTVTEEERASLEADLAALLSRLMRYEAVVRLPALVAGAVEEMIERLRAAGYPLSEEQAEAIRWGAKGAHPSGRAAESGGCVPGAAVEVPEAAAKERGTSRRRAPEH